MRRPLVLLLASLLLLSVSACTRLGLGGPQKAKPSPAEASTQTEAPVATLTPTAQSGIGAPATPDRTQVARAATKTAVLFRQQTKLVQYTLTAQARSATQTGTPTLESSLTVPPAVSSTSTATALPTWTTPPSVATPTATTVPTVSSRPITYVVQRGDTLYRLALRFGVRTETLAAANGIAAPYNIQVGQILTIPAHDGWVSVTPYTVKAGDSLYSIAQAWGLDWHDLANANGLSWPYRIYVGQELAIPVPHAASVTPPAVLTPQSPTVTASLMVTASPTATPSPSATATQQAAATKTPLAGWTVYNVHTGSFSLHHPSSWTVAADTVNVAPLGLVDRLAVRPSGSSGLVANEGGVLVIGLQRTDSLSLLELWRAHIASLLPGSGQATSIEFSWDPAEATQLSGQPAVRMPGTMTVRMSDQPDSVMKIWLGAVVHGDLNYGLYFKASEGAWAATYMAVFEVMIETFVLK